MASQPAPLFETTPPGFRLDDVVIRLARPEERTRWDERVDRHHYLGVTSVCQKTLFGHEVSLEGENNIDDKWLD